MYVYNCCICGWSVVLRLLVVRGNASVMAHGMRYIAIRMLYIQCTMCVCCVCKGYGESTD